MNVKQPIYTHPKMKHNFPFEVAGMICLGVFAVLFVIMWSAALQGVIL